MTNPSIKAAAAVQSGVVNARSRATDERGAVMAEYGLLLALIAVMIIAAMVAFRDTLFGVFNDATEELGGTAATNANEGTDLSG